METPRGSIMYINCKGLANENQENEHQMLAAPAMTTGLSAYGARAAPRDGTHCVLAGGSNSGRESRFRAAAVPPARHRHLQVLLPRPHRRWSAGIQEPPGIPQRLTCCVRVRFWTKGRSLSRAERLRWGSQTLRTVQRRRAVENDPTVHDDDETSQSIGGRITKNWHVQPGEVGHDVAISA